MTSKKSAAPMQLKIALTGDQRLTENVILEVRAVARRYGLEIPSIEVERRPSTPPKTAKSKSRRGGGSKARSRSSG